MEFDGTIEGITPEGIIGALDQVVKKTNGVHPVTNEPRGIAILRECKLDLLGEVKEPPICISIEQNGTSIRFGTLGNMSLVIGKAKTRKTFVISMVVAAALPDSEFQNTIKCTFPEDKKHIAYFDTEQSDFDVYNVIMRSFTMAGGRKEDLDKIIDVYVFAGKGPEEIIEAIDTYLNSRSDIGLVVIDGARDLIWDILNSKESVTVATNFRRWTKENNLHLLTILHQNKGDSNARGHFGAELENKSETIAEVIKHNDSNISTVQPFRCRGKDFDKFSFEVDDNGIPHILDSYNSDGPAIQPRTKIPSNTSFEKHQEAIQIMFSTNDQIEGGKIHDEVITAYSMIGIDFGLSVARRFLTYLIKKKLIIHLPHQKGNKTFYLLPGTDEK